jgi:hypothetical protein
MSSTTFDRGDHFRFGLVFIKKSNQTDFFFETKNQNRVKPTGFGSVRFGFFRAKTGSNRFGSVFPVLAQFSRFWLGFFQFWLGFLGFGLVFSGFGSVFSVWLGFFLVFCRVRFGFFRFFAYKTETEPAGFFKNVIGLIGFFFGLVFSVIFSGFLGLIGFPVFLLTPNI